jgi:hypothetical protein
MVKEGGPHGNEDPGENAKRKHPANTQACLGDAHAVSLKRNVLGYQCLNRNSPVTQRDIST